MTVVRKRQQLTAMKYDRVDLVPEGANAHAHILIAKNRGRSPQVLTVRKAMGSVKCNNCGSMNGKGASVCRACHSTDLAKTRIEITKTVENPRTKKVPKNDDAANSTSNASGYTFEDEQYDQDNGENGQALGDSVERNILAKGWFEEPIRKDDVDDVDNERYEHEKEGEDSDDDIEELSVQKPVGTRPDRSSGYTNGASGAVDVTTMGKSRSGIKRKFLKEKPGHNSFDYTDQGSQEIAESAEQMYRSESQPTEEAQERRESTMSDVLAKARRRRKNSEGLDALENGNEGIYQRPGVKRNGTNTGHNKTTNSGRTAVAPPRNPLDVGKSLRVRKNRGLSPLAQLEALNIGVGMAENIGLIMKSGRSDLYEATMQDFIETMNAAFGEWQAGSTITKAKATEAQVEDVANRVNAILAKASPEAEMSDEASEGEGANEVDSKRPSIPSKKSQNAGEDNTSVGKNRVGINKSLEDEDPYAGLSDVVKSQLHRLAELEENTTQQFYLKKAKELRNLPGFNADRIAKQLRNTYETLGEEDGDMLFQTLSASANAVQDSGVYKQLGMPGVGTMATDDPMARAYEFADSTIQKGNVQKTREVLIAEYMRDHGAEFYAPAKSL